MIYMEHCHLPMQVIFQNEELTAEVEAIVRRDTGHGIERFKEAPTSFHQMVSLDEDSDISERGKRQIYTLLSRWDKLVPFPLVEMYPFLKQEEWALPMKDVSHLKVYIQKPETEYTKAENTEAEKTEAIQWIFAVESIEKRKKPDSGKIVLLCYPCAGEVDPEFVMESLLSTFPLIDDKKVDSTSKSEPRMFLEKGKKCFLYEVENEQVVYEIMKNIFLTGRWVISY